jgi:hypothetical protein
MEDSHDQKESAEASVGLRTCLFGGNLLITARGSNQRPGLDEIKRQTISISEWLDFEFYDPVWY